MDETKKVDPFAVKPVCGAHGLWNFEIVHCTLAAHDEESPHLGRTSTHVLVNWMS